jgi:hypothetical protein
MHPKNRIKQIKNRYLKGFLLFKTTGVLELVNELISDIEQYTVSMPRHIYLRFSGRVEIIESLILQEEVHSCDYCDNNCNDECIKHYDHSHHMCDRCFRNYAGMHSDVPIHSAKSQLATSKYLKFQSDVIISNSNTLDDFELSADEKDFWRKQLVVQELQWYHSFLKPQVLRPSNVSTNYPTFLDERILPNPV